ncbi:hypothetical protein XENOCAPTIV_023216 [Xenoophorus captivus]|uniref:Uncharacterized protein n=1 Tax=Xenoophorus captivus TaxID=1517983 RepID=A0ABV0QF61_9TELE
MYFIYCKHKRNRVNDAEEKRQNTMAKLGCKSLNIVDPSGPSAIMLGPSCYIFSAAPAVRSFPGVSLLSSVRQRKSTQRSTLQQDKQTKHTISLTLFRPAAADMGPGISYGPLFQGHA